MQEAQPFEQRHALVRGLGQHPPVESQQAEFAIQVILGRKAGFQCVVRHRASSMIFLKYRPQDRYFVARMLQGDYS